ncbi:uncharacterized protein [Anser cygnoides]|uniref:uncharacterized protein isoform X2 n=1 Tax=Anser cygnoides TaxID=8845 RepID=UPI0034D314F0
MIGAALSQSPRVLRGKGAGPRAPGRSGAEGGAGAIFLSRQPHAERDPVAPRLFCASGSDGEQRDEQDGPALAQLAGVHREPQHAGGEEERRGGHLRQVRQDRRLLRAQGLRLRPVRRRAQRPRRRRRRGRPHDRRAGAGHQPGGRAQGEPRQGGRQALGGGDVRVLLRLGLRLPAGLLRQDVQLPGARAAAAAHRARRGALQAAAGLRQHLAARQERLQLQERPARLLLQIRQIERRRPAGHQEGAEPDQAEGGRAAREPREDREGAEAEGRQGGGGAGRGLGQEGGGRRQARGRGRRLGGGGRPPG